MDEFQKFSQFTKVQEQPDGRVLVWGIATHEEPDLDGEICDYDTAVAVYRKWSDAAKSRTSGAGQEISLGNVRLQHGLEIGGKATRLEFDDENKAILLGSVPLNDEILNDVRDGFYTGYSQGGSYAWRKCADCGKNMSLQQANNFCSACKKNVQVLYGLKRLSEVSYVDSPCTGVGFEYVKSDGSKKFVKFAKRGERVELTKEQIQQIAAEVKKGKTKRVGWKDIAAAKASGLDLGEAGVTKAMRDFISAVDVKAASANLEKGLYSVGRLADVLQTLSWLYEDAVIEREIEGDDSEVPDELKAVLEHLVDIFIASATEEAKELAAKKADIPKGGSMTPEEQKQQEELQKAAKKSLATHFAKSAVMHEKVAKAHREAAESHEDMCDAAKSAHKACKADVGDGETQSNVAHADYYKAAGEHHADKCAFHEKCAKAHEGLAEHLHKMAESHDKEEAEKAVKAERGADPAPVQKSENADDFMTQAVKKAQTDLLADPAFMAKVRQAQEESLLSGIVQKTVEAEVEKRRETTLAPAGVSPANAAGLRLAQRETSTFKLASASASASDTGI